MYKVSVECDYCKKIHEVSIKLNVIAREERELGKAFFHYGKTIVQCECYNLLTVELDGFQYPADEGEIEIINTHVIGGFKSKAFDRYTEVNRYRLSTKY